MLVAVLPRNAGQLRWAVYTSLQAVYQVRVRRIETNIRRRFVSVINAPGGVSRHWKTR